MPVITVAIRNLTSTEKTSLIEKLTTSASEATKIPEQNFFTFIQEYDEENIGLGGKTLKEVQKGR